MNDQYYHSRIPIRPLAYKNRDLASTDELIIDYGNTGKESWHIYLSDHTDPTKLIDLTNLITEKVIPKTAITADQFYISLEGETEPYCLKDIMNHIYKRYIYPDNYGVFKPELDLNKLMDDDTLSCLLRDSGGRVIIPVTMADNVFFQNGLTLADTFNERTKFGFTTINITIPSDTDKIEFDYPYENYTDHVEVRRAGLYISNTEYNIEPNVIDSDGTYFTGFLSLTNNQLFTAGERIDIVFIYNAKISPDVKNYTVDGKTISLHSIPSNRIDKVSDSIYDKDSGSIASSKAVATAFDTITRFMIDNAENSAWCKDVSNYNNLIHIENNDKNIINYDYFLISVLLQDTKNTGMVGLIKYRNDALSNIPILDADGNLLTHGLPGNKIAKFLWVKSERALRLLPSGVRQTRYIHRCEEDELEISYNGLSYELDACINVYRNGNRLFEDLDYSIDRKNETINLYQKASLDETIVFEALSV